MPTIRTHDITLYGGNERDIVLRPLCDDHIPLLCKWNADPELLYWTEGGTNDENLSYDENTVRDIYGGVSQHAHCFLVEADGAPVGECWLQRMNLPDVLCGYHGLDVRRIDMAIGEKAWWGRGIGTQFIGMLVDFAFCGEHVDVLHCFCEDYNARSMRMWQKHGFSLARADHLEQPQKGKFQYHYVLTRAQFIARRRYRPSEREVFEMPLRDLQPSQLYISEGKLRLAREWFDARDRASMDAIPVKRVGERVVMTDGHTRAVLAMRAGWTSVPVYWDGDELNMAAYALDVQWCLEAGITSAPDLARRVVPHAEYERLWRKRCMEMVI